VKIHSIPKQVLILALMQLSLTACQDSPSNLGSANSAATASTIDANAAVAKALPLEDQRDFEEATRGLIATPDNLRITSDRGELIWDMPAYDFIQGKAPATVNPSLWRQAKLNNIHGLFEVTDGVYQLRGFDLANMSIIEGDNSWIIVDPLTSKENARAALAFARKHLGNKPISAVIFTHSHLDHFGGVMGLFEKEMSKALGNVEIIAPSGFMEEATSENVMAGTTMSRRAMFMYGQRLEKSDVGHVGSGLGKQPASGSVGILAPTITITRTGETHIIDGVEFVFQNVPGSEAPAELTFYLPQKKTFCGAEMVSRTMHNIYTLRGAKVRDANKWSAYIDQAIDHFGEADVYFGSHHWPMWGNAEIIDFLEKQRAGYKYIHDQTLRLAAKGHTPKEIAELLQMPESLNSSFPNRGYYGTLKHNAKAVYQGYFGWYDGNPANLDPLPPIDAAKRYVTLMGGAENILASAQKEFDKGDYRWVAELLNHLVFAEPDNQQAKELLAKSYDQLGYQAESGPWRDVYLTGALELRQGSPKNALSKIDQAADLLMAMPVEQFFNTMAVMFKGPDAAGKRYTINVEFTDRNENYVLSVKNAVLHHRLGQPVAEANASIRITHALFLKIIAGQAGIRDTVFSDDVSVEGSKLDLLGFFSLIEKPNETFNIVTPNS
jgi:linear primary-alkylsulfatase